MVVAGIVSEDASGCDDWRTERLGGPTHTYRRRAVSRVLRIVGVTIAALCAAPLPAAAAPWSWPVRGRLVSRFAVGPDRFAPGQRRGIVIAAPAGVPVRAACAGTVSFAGFVGDSGLTVAVSCGALTATYVHLGSLLVRRGAAVAREQRIGSVGLSGRPRHPVPQVGLGARLRGGDRGYVDPLRLLGEPDPTRPGAPAGPPPARIPPPSGRPPLSAPTPARSAPGLSPVAAPGGALPLGRLWLPAGAGLLAAGLGAGGIGAAVAASRRRRRARPAGPPATRGGAQTRR